MQLSRSEKNTVNFSAGVARSTVDELPSPPSCFLLGFMCCVTHKNPFHRTGQGADSWAWFGSENSLNGDCLHVCCPSRLLAEPSGEDRRRVKEHWRGGFWKQRLVALVNPHPGPVPPKYWDIYTEAKISWWFAMQSNYCQQHQQRCSCSSQPWTWAAGSRQLVSNSIAA